MALVEHTSRPRLALATVALGAAAALIAPQWVAAAPGDGPVADTPALDAPGRAVSAAAVAGAIGNAVADAVGAGATVEVPAHIEVPAQIEVPVVAAAEVPDAPAAPATPAPPADLPDTAPPAPQTASPAPPAPPSAAPARAEEPTTAAITVRVAARDGATRTVSLQTPAGDPVGERVTVTGAPVSFEDLAPGTYELFVEQVADGGGAFLTRTIVTVEAGEHAVLSCDPESLDCTR